MYFQSRWLLHIDLYRRYGEMFAKPSTKKKHVWGLIAADLSSETFALTGKKTEQKWKNLTKTYRDTVDYNSKSGNEPKKCPFFNELQDVYGFRPNIKPIFPSMMGSCTPVSSSSLETTREIKAVKKIKKEEKKETS